MQKPERKKMASVNLRYNKMSRVTHEGGTDRWGTREAFGFMKRERYEPYRVTSMPSVDKGGGDYGDQNAFGPNGIKINPAKRIAEKRQRQKIKLPQETLVAYQSYPGNVPSGKHSGLISGISMGNDINVTNSNSAIINKMTEWASAASESVGQFIPGPQTVAGTAAAISSLAAKTLPDPSLRQWAATAAAGISAVNAALTPSTSYTDIIAPAASFINQGAQVAGEAMAVLHEMSSDMYDRPEGYVSHLTSGMTHFGSVGSLPSVMASDDDDENKVNQFLKLEEEGFKAVQFEANRLKLEEVKRVKGRITEHPIKEFVEKYSKQSFSNFETNDLLTLARIVQGDAAKKYIMLVHDTMKQFDVDQYENHERWYIARALLDANQFKSPDSLLTARNPAEYAAVLVVTTVGLKLLEERKLGPQDVEDLKAAMKGLKAAGDKIAL